MVRLTTGKRVTKIVRERETFRIQCPSQPDLFPSNTFTTGVVDRPRALGVLGPNLIVAPHQVGRPPHVTPRRRTSPLATRWGPSPPFATRGATLCVATRWGAPCLHFATRRARRTLHPPLPFRGEGPTPLCASRGTPPPLCHKVGDPPSHFPKGGTSRLATQGGRLFPLARRMWVPPVATRWGTPPLLVHKKGDPSACHK